MQEDQSPERDDDAPPDTWRNRHAATIMGGVLAALLAMVIINQVAC